MSFLQSEQVAVRSGAIRRRRDETFVTRISADYLPDRTRASTHLAGSSLRPNMTLDSIPPSSLMLLSSPTTALSDCFRLELDAAGVTLLAAVMALIPQADVSALHDSSFSYNL